MKRFISVLLVLFLLAGSLTPAFAEPMNLPEEVQETETVVPEAPVEEATVLDATAPEADASEEEAAALSDEPAAEEAVAAEDDAAEEATEAVESDWEEATEEATEAADEDAVQENEEAMALFGEEEEEPVFAPMATVRNPNLTKFELSKTNLDLLSTFDLSIEWDASKFGNTLVEGDYFVIQLPEQLHFPNSPELTHFPLKNEEGVTIANAVVTPESEGTPGSVRVIFAKEVEGLSNVKGTLRLGSVRFTDAYVDNNEQRAENEWTETFTVTANGSSASTGTIPVKKPDVSDEGIVKWGERVNEKPDEVRWMIRMNWGKGTYSNVVITDAVSGITGIRLLTDTFVLQKVEVDSIGRVSKVISQENPIESGKLTLTPANSETKTGFVLNLGDIGPDDQYRLYYHSTYVPGMTANNHIKVTSNDNVLIERDVTYQSAYSGGDASGDLQIRIIKVDEGNNTVRLPGAKFRVRLLPNGEPFEMITGDNGVATSAKLTAGTYEIIEVEAPAGYILDGTPIEAIVQEGQVTLKTVTNKKAPEEPDTVSVPVEKVWHGDTLTSVTVELLANGTKIQDAVLNAANEWKHTFANLPRLNDEGAEIEYTVRELALERYVSAVTKNSAGGFVITNTQTIDTFVKKVWEGGPATESITVRILANGTLYRTIVLNAANNWYAEIKDIPLYDENGNLIDYTAEEVSVEGYTTEITGDCFVGYTIKNVADNPEFTSAKVKKVWDGPALEQVTLKLLADGVLVEEVVLSDANNWEHEFTDLPVYNSNGVPIVYSLQEPVAEGYVTTITGNCDVGFTVTNTKTQPDTISIPVEKVWVGEATESVVVKLLANGVVTAEATLNASNEWKYTFANLPELDDEGNAIVYAIEEVTVPGYNTTIAKDDKGVIVITNTKTTPEPERVNVPVKKVWVGDSEASVVVKLKANGVVIDQVKLNAANNWAHTFTNLPKTDADGVTIVYAIEEVTVPGYNTTITKDSTGVTVITNTKITPEPEKVNVPVKKVWVGGTEASVVVKLKANGVVIDQITLNAANNWAHTFANLPKTDADGVTIVYAIEEVTVPGYNTTITKDSTGVTVITNTKITPEPERVNIPVSKVWVGGTEGSVLVKLYADGVYLQQAVLSSANAWKHTFANLPKYNANGNLVVYTIEEVRVPGYTTVITGTAAGGFTITNTKTTPEPERVQVPVKKVWVGGTEASVVVKLLANGVAIDQVTLSAANGWSHTFTNLPKVDANGQAIVYTIEEVKVPGYTTVITGTAAGGFTITNTKTTPEPEKVNVPVKKVWVGGTEANVVVKLLANGVAIDQVTLSAANGWNHTFTNLPKVDANGQAIVYTIEEVTVNGYKTTITGSVAGGFTVTNTKVTKPDVPKTETPPSKTPPTKTPGKPGVRIPETGDSLSIVFLAAGVALITVGAVLVRRKEAR